MKIPFFDLLRIYQIQKDQIDAEIQKVLQSGWYVLGQAGQEFETAFGRYVSSQSSGNFVSCNSGTDALILALLALGVGVGDEVITVSHTAIPTITAIVSTGAKPVFVDIHAQTWLMDMAWLAEKITAKTKVIIPVHLYGNMVNVSEIQTILKKLKREDISILEDVAQASGSRFENQQAGTLGRMGAFSFYPTKNLGALGDGGGVYCSNESDAASIKKLRQYGQKDRYLAETPRGINSRLDEVQAAVLNVRLKKLDEWNQFKNRMIVLYRDQLKSLPISFQKETPECTPGWHLAVIACESENIRNDLKKHLEQQGIQTMVHYPTPTHLQPAFKEFKKETLPVTESLAPRILSLALNPGVQISEQQEIISQVKKYFG